MHFGDGDAGLEFAINAKELTDFVRQFTDSNRLLLQFPGTGAQDWSISLAGTTAVSGAFASCVLRSVPCAPATYSLAARQ